MLKNKRGITLIALIITVIVLLILAGVTISMLAGENGIIKQAVESRRKSLYSQEAEKIELAYTSSAISKYQNDGIINFEEEIKKEFGEETNIESNGDGTYTVTLPNGNEHTVGNKIENVIVEETAQSAYDIKVYGYEISLDGEVAINIYLDIPENKFQDKETIKIVNENNSAEEKTINVVPQNFKVKTINNKKYYLYKYVFKPVNMVDEIKLRAYKNGDEDSIEYAFSMKEIGNKIINNSSTSEKMSYFVKCLLNLGAYGQLFFAESQERENLKNNPSKLANENWDFGIDYLQNILIDRADGLISHEIKELNNDYIVGTFFTCLFESKIPCRFRVKLKDDTQAINKITVNGKVKELKTLSNNIYYIIFSENIILEDFNKKYDIKIYNSNDEQIGNIITSFMDMLCKDVELETNIDNAKYHKALYGALCLYKEAYMDLIK